MLGLRNPPAATSSSPRGQGTFRRSRYREAHGAIPRGGLAHVPLLQQMNMALAIKSDHSMPLEFFRDILDEALQRRRGQKQIETVLLGPLRRDLHLRFGDRPPALVPPLPKTIPRGVPFELMIAAGPPPSFWAELPVDIASGAVFAAAAHRPSRHRRRLRAVLRAAVAEPLLDGAGHRARRHLN
jgi:hypothetical protein